ncbi:MAG: hypothetical protein KDC54_12065 [Lewinella sp.]|nr:hypothetical protein [Lewinella sp.]
MKRVSPFAGFPRTRLRKRKGKPVFEVKPNILTPRAAKFADDLSGLCLFLWIGVLFFNVALLANVQGWAWLVYWGSALLITPVSRWLFREFLKNEIRMELDEEEFRIKHWFSWKRFDRTLDHGFAVPPHDLTKDEQENEEYQVRAAQMKGRLVRKRRYYAESCHLVFVYLGQRIDLVEIYGHKEGVAVKARLELCDAILNTQTKMGPVAVTDPDDEWGDGPGDIDDLD